MTKILIDTNILVYSINSDSDFYNSSIKLLQDTKLDLFTTSKNISEFITVVTKLPGRALDVEAAVRIVNNFESFIKILYADKESLELFKKLLLQYKISGLKVHDMEIISIMLSNGINSIATNNTKDFAGIRELNIIDWQGNLI